MEPLRDEQLEAYRRDGFVVLGPILESNLRNALIGSKMDQTVFVTRPISAVILAGIVLLIWVWGREDRRQRRLVAAQLGEDVAEARDR